MNIESVTEQARRHERDEEWRKALDLYMSAIERLSDADETDISILNRAADLQVRVGSLDEAMELYHRAIDLYLEADLPNNAMAICRKIGRHLPGEVEVFRRMGQIRAIQGFTVDARENYLTYAQILQTRGEAGQALEGLRELVERIPQDWESRALLAEGLLQQDRGQEAVEQLRAAWEHLVRQEGEEDRAEALRERILDLDPQAAPTPPASPGEEEEGGGWEDEGEVEGFEASAAPADEAAPSETEARTDVPEALEDLPFQDELENLPFQDELGELPFQEILSGESEGAEPAAEREGAPAVGEGGEAGEREMLDSRDPSWGEDLRLEDSPPGDEGTDAALDLGDLPFLEVPPEPEAEDATGPEPPAAALAPAGTGPEVLPDPVASARNGVEEAYESGDRDALILGLLELARSLAQAGEDEAETVFGQVLQLDPGNREALRALGRSGPFDGPLAGGEGEEGYVDLGSMILDEALEEKTTRWTVAAEEPSEDEDADFARMLSQFKSKVAQHLEGEDARSQYDLGTAYRQMGLLEEAIAMFQRALRMEPGHLGSIEMLGQCFLDREDPQVAIRVLSRGTEEGRGTEDELVGIYYFLGQAHEAAGNPGEAREFYEKVFALDINFRDVTERLRALR